jgi:glycine betaine/proline transport system substrate-binding protein
MNTNFDIAYLEGGDDWYGPNFGGATVSTQVRAGYVSECPEVGKLLTQLSFDVALESEGMGYILEDGMSAEDAARSLIAKHPEKLDVWLDGVSALDGTPALAAVTADLRL